MTDKLKQSVKEVDKDLAHSWIDLSTNVKNLAADLKLKAAGTAIAGDADHLSQEAARLCDHVERLHADVIDLLDNIESRMPIQENDAHPYDVENSDVEKERIQIQQEHHELRSDFKDVIKALFMWRDDPVERIRNRE